MARTTFELVIFDCDGVLVDSERLSNQVFADMLGEIGVGVTLDYMYDNFKGHSMAHCMELVAALLYRRPEPGFAEAYRIRVRQAFATQLQAVPGIADALDGIGLPYSSPRAATMTRCAPPWALPACCRALKENCSA